MPANIQFHLKQDVVFDSRRNMGERIYDQPGAPDQIKIAKGGKLIKKFGG